MLVNSDTGDTAAVVAGRADDAGRNRPVSVGVGWLAVAVHDHEAVRKGVDDPAFAAPMKATLRRVLEACLAFARGL